MSHILADELRAAVLQAAIQGKLTKQLPEDGNAQDLIEQIKTEKEQLIKDRKITKEKDKSPQKSQRDKAFDIPSNWEWAYFGDITFNLDSKRIPLEKGVRAKQDNKVYDYYGASGIIDKVDDYIFDGRLLLIGEDGANLLARSTPIAFIADGKFWVNNHAHVLDVGKYMLIDYLCMYINAIDLSYYVTGTAQPKMNQANMNSIRVSLPPLAEQHRIVARVEDLMAKIDEYEKLENQLAELKEKFPEEMKAAILQEAMEGKLTDRCKNDSFCEITSTLLEDNYELPDIPDSWKWCAIDDVLSFQTGLSFKKHEQKNKETGSLRVLRGGNINDNMKYDLFDNDVYVDFNAFASKYIPLRKDDIIMPSVTSMQKMCKTAMIDKDMDNVTAGGFVYIIRVKDSSSLDAKFAQYFLSSQFHKTMCIPNIHKSGQAFYNLKKTGLIMQPICIPPVEEQRRIVEKLDALLLVCDELAEMA